MTKPSLTLLLFAVVLSVGSVRGDDAPSFNREIRPILSENCFYCHGFDPKNRKAELRLDTYEGATADRDGVIAVVPGSLENSALWERISSNDDADRMPPPDSHKSLTAAQKELLRRWIVTGAKYEPHWAFVAPVRPAVAEGQKPIDYFVEQKLVAAGLTFSPEADRPTLLRRVTLDLTGLPPTLAELDAFLADSSDNAYERVVDRLLQSPRYGERMATDWLDAARYADSNGFQMDAARMNWPWRDWVLRAFNSNMPYDRFTIEQLAGDLLPFPTQDQLIATAFNRNHMLNAEGGTIPEENRTKNVFDRVETTGAVWLGLTLNCTQCHDHKFDPITQRDYYALYALFNQLSEPGGVDKRFGKKAYSDDYDNSYMVESPYITLATETQKQDLAEAEAALKVANANLAAERPKFHPRFVAWVERMRADKKLLDELPDDTLQRAVTLAKLENDNDYWTKRLLEYYLKQAEPFVPVITEVIAKRTQVDLVLETIPHVMVMRDDKPRETFILQRGDYQTPGEKVAPAVPASLPPLPVGTQVNRLALAKWLVSAEHPLTARVTVNRLWQQFFGRGLVKTPEDFGLQGALPSHPELLDWLAVDFRESGWDVKRFVRQLVTSRTYRQSHAAHETLLARDPANVLLSRGPRFRLDSRALRDQALALSGLLIERRGGAPVLPYQPPGIWEEMSFDKNRYVQGHGEALYRRSLYTFWRRSVGPANFFDVPNRQTCAVEPKRTSTPLHALTTLNDVTYVEAARVWAERLATGQSPSTKDQATAGTATDDARLQLAFRAATCRLPESRELAVLQRTLERARAHFATRPAEAERLIAAGEAARQTTLSAAEHAAWTTVCLTVLNLDETLTKP